MLCSRVHDRTISAVRYLPEEGLVATIAFDNTLRIFNALQSTLRCTVTNDMGGPFVAMEHDAALSQVSLLTTPFTIWLLMHCRRSINGMQPTALQGLLTDTIALYCIVT